MHAYIQIYTYTQICTNCSECIRRCVRWCKKYTCVTYTPAHALVPKTPFPKCMQHSLQKNAHIYIPTHICIRRHMHTNTHAHAWHRPHAEALIQRPTIYAQIRIHIHIHMCINAYMYIYIHICIYIHVYMSAHIHTYTYIHTHIQNVHMNARTHAWNDGAAANARGAVADEGNFARLFRLTQSNHISHLQCKDFIVPTCWNTNTPPPPILSSQHTPEQFADRGQAHFSCSTLIRWTECIALKKLRAASQWPLA